MSRRAALLAWGIVAGVWCLTGGLTASPVPAPPSSQTPVAEPPRPRRSLPSDAEIEQFLPKGRLSKTRGAGKGITGSTRGTMTDEGLRTTFTSR